MAHLYSDQKYPGIHGVHHDQAKALEAHRYMIAIRAKEEAVYLITIRQSNAAASYHTGDAVNAVELWSLYRGTPDVSINLQWTTGEDR